MEQICDICGKTTNHIHKIFLEGSIVNACESCKHLGKEIKDHHNLQEKHSKSYDVEEEEIEDLVENYGKIIEKEIIKRYSSLENFCKKYSMSCSYLHKIIREELKPTIEEARRLEKILHIKLVIKERITQEIKNQKNEPLKLGMFIKDERLRKLLEEE